MRNRTTEEGFTLAEARQREERYFAKLVAMLPVYVTSEQRKGGPRAASACPAAGCKASSCQSLRRLQLLPHTAGSQATIVSWHHQVCCLSPAHHHHAAAERKE